MTARWAAIDGPGLEHLELRLAARSQGVVSAVVGVNDGVPFGASYRMLVGPDWTFRNVHIDTGLAGVRKIARSVRGGDWTVDRAAVPELAGCTDIDITITPFTNTLPIRRLGLAVGGTAEIRVAWLTPPEYRPRAVLQRYTRVAERRWLFEQPGIGFQAELEVDAEGLVVDYPGLFRRLLP